MRTPRRPARRTAGLAAAALVLTALPGMAAVSATSAAAAPVAAAAGGPVAARAEAPVADRLQPWLARTLTTADPARPLPVMVSGTSTSAALAAVSAAGLTTLQTWDTVGIVVAAGPPAAVRAVVGQPGVRYVEGDQPLQYTLDQAHTATRSEQALTTYKAADGSRVDGTGVTVAVIDSGIDGTHPFFMKDGESKVVRNLKNTCGAVFVPGTNETCYQDIASNDTDTESAGGHGTHVAGIVAGYEVTTTAPAGVKLRGAAPGAKLVGLSVGAAIGLLDANSAMNWVLEHQAQPCRPKTQQDGPADPACPPIRATNHSYGPIATEGEDQVYDEESATVTLQRALIGKGVTPVWAAGNDGGDGSFAATNPPAMDPTPGVLMVASYDDGQTGSRDNALSEFSSRGKKGFAQTYPDVAAPGDLITSSCRAYLSVCNGAPAYDGLNYQTISGTSMATPYVAGVVAQLVQAQPGITPGQAEELLEDTAHKFTSGGEYEADPRNGDDTTSFDKGHGLVDVLAVQAAQQGLPEPGAPAPSCVPGGAQVTDPEGDATQAAVADTPAPSAPSLDVREGRISFDATAQALTFAIRVTDLSAGPPTASSGEYFRFYFTRESDGELFVVANRDPAGDVFSLSRFEDATASTTSVRVTGAFDEATSTVRVTVPLSAYKAFTGVDVAPGDEISVGQLLGQRDTGTATLTADTASGSCGYTVAPAATAPSGSPSATATASTQPEASPPTDPTVPLDPSPQTSGSPTASGSPASTSGPGGSDGGQPASASPTPSPTASAATAGNPPPSSSPGGAAAGATCTEPSLRTVTPSVAAGQPGEIRVDAAPGATVRVFAYSRPSTSYRQVREGVVGADGVAVFTVRPGGNTRAYAQVVGCGATSRSATMNVRTTMNLAAKRLGPRDYVFSGQAVPGRPGQIISLYTGRTLLAQGRTDQAGRYAIRRAFQRAARLDLHAFAGRNITADEGRSRTRPTIVH